MLVYLRWNSGEPSVSATPARRRRLGDRRRVVGDVAGSRVGIGRRRHVTPGSCVAGEREREVHPADERAAC